MPPWSLAVYFGAVVVLVVVMLVLPRLLGPRHEEPATGKPYESGILVTGPAHIRFSAHFYLVAMFFVVFDVEAVFLFAWAVAAPRLGWLGYAEMAVFIVVLLAGLAYLWQQGALDWGSLDRPRLESEAEREEQLEGRR